MAHNLETNANGEALMVYAASGSTNMINLRFECGSEDRYSAHFGPFDYAQIVGAELTVGPDGEVIAALVGGWWTVCEHTAQLPQDVHGTRWSDVIIFGEPQRWQK